MDTPTAFGVYRDNAVEPQRADVFEDAAADARRGRRYFGKIVSSRLDQLTPAKAR